MIEMGKQYPYFNDDAETRWRENNLNLQMDNDMKMTTMDDFLEVSEIDAYKVHDIIFIQDRGSSLPTVQCSPHSAAKEM